MGEAWDHLPHVYLMKGAWIICLMFASWGEHGSFASWLPHGRSWPSITSLPSQCHTMVEINHELIAQHHPEWLSDQHFPIVFTQEFQRPRPTKRFKGTTAKPITQPLQYLEKDPTETNTPPFAHQKTSLIHSPNLIVPHISSDHCLLSRLRKCICTWDLQHIKHQSLWGDPFQEDAKWDRMQQEKNSARRQRFRDPSPAGSFRTHDREIPQPIPGTPHFIATIAK